MSSKRTLTSPKRTRRCGLYYRGMSCLRAKRRPRYNVSGARRVQPPYTDRLDVHVVRANARVSHVIQPSHTLYRSRHTCAGHVTTLYWSRHTLAGLCAYFQGHVPSGPSTCVT
eukprot:3244925-Rhodomonas_salina.3